MAPIPNPLNSLPSAHSMIDGLVRRSPFTPAISKTYAPALPSKLLRLLKRQTEILIKRQSLDSGGTMVIPSTYGSINNSMAPGTVIGIVLGSVAGFLFIIWLFYACATLSGGRGSEYGESVVVARRKSHAGSHRSARSHRASETIEVRRDAPPVRIVREPSRGGHVIVEETRETRRAVSRAGSDEVVVIEEHSPPRRSKSKRETGYRTVDPDGYAGVPGARKERRGSSGRR